MKSILLAVTLLLPVLAGKCVAQGVQGSTSFVNLPFSVLGEERTAALYVPPGYTASKSWPMIVFLHGGGGGGDNRGNALNTWMRKQPIVQAIRRHPERFPALVLIPRCPKGKIWAPIPSDPVQSAWRLRHHGRQPAPDAEVHVTAAIDAAIASYSVDNSRITLTGHSMGGEGTTRYAALHADRFAGIAPSAGSAVIVMEDVPELATMGVWMFQGENDDISTVGLARRLSSAIRAAGGELRYTEYENAGHGTAALVYEDAEVIDWLVKQKKPENEDPSGVNYPIVDTGQLHCYDDQTAIEFPKPGSPYYGQDAHYAGRRPSYSDNGDGTISDLVTGLMWTKDPAPKRPYDEAVANASKCDVGGYNDWRLPSIKELYSLIQFNGIDPDATSSDSAGLTPFIDENVFAFHYGKREDGDRIIDSQFATRTRYVSTTMNGHETMFGVNFADGRIKGYPTVSRRRGEPKTYYTLYVRSNPAYGKNEFTDNADGTITDEATGLTWMKADSGQGMNWPAALEYAEALTLAGHDDWRLPNAKELQSIVDYSRSPDTSGSPAIDPVFETTEITNEGGKKDFGWYWSSTSHLRGRGSRAAVYVTFGRSLGWMPDRRSNSGRSRLMDVHGAGSQRSDPKVGDASNFPQGRGPQGDVIRIENRVRCVRGGDVQAVKSGPTITRQQVTRQRRAPGPRGFMTRLDKNNDGKVSRSEFDGPNDHFHHLDGNGDGVITEAEAPTGPPPGRR
jgi:poly(3-hydroxybutyrate) depolymerase